MDSIDHWYHIEYVDEIDTPFLAVYKARIQFNIDQMIRIAGGANKLQPHVKTYKMPEVVAMQINSGINKFKCATIAEAEMLGMSEARQILLAYQPNSVKLQRLISLIFEYPGSTFSTIIDNISAADMIDKACGVRGIKLDIYLDINNGNNRTGILPAEAPILIKKCGHLNNIILKGFHVYDGHIHLSDFEERKIKCDEDYMKIEEAAETYISLFNENPLIIAGGSPTFPIHADRPEVITSPGTTLFWDAGYGEKFDEMPFIQAAVLITRVISIPGEGIICLDLGHKSVASENPLENRVRFLNGEGLIPISQSEEHLVVENSLNANFEVGDIIYALPYHICPTTALYNEVAVVENNKVVANWKVAARGRRILI